MRKIPKFSFNECRFNAMAWVDQHEEKYEGITSSSKSIRARSFLIEPSITGS